MPERVRVELPPQLQGFTRSPVIYEDVQSARELLKSLITRYPGFPRLLDDRDKLRLGVRLYANQSCITDLDAELPFSESVRIVLIPVGRLENQGLRCPPWGERLT